MHLVPRLLVLLIVAGLATAACVNQMPPHHKAESIVEKARWTVESFKANPEEPYDVFRDNLRTARGIVVIPSLFKGAFFVGGEGGEAVLLTRNDAGEWSYPAFYSVGSGSFGAQAGAQSSEIVLFLRSDEAVAAVIDDQGKLGADLELTFGTLGAGLEGATTTNLGADVVGVADSAGLFAGVSLEGTALVRRNDLNQAYYGTPASPQDIVLDRRYRNGHADSLRRSLVF